MVPLPISAAALAVFGKGSTVEAAPQFGASTVVLAALAANVKVPAAFERPSVSCRIANTILARSRSSPERVGPLIDSPPGRHRLPRR